MNDPLRLEKKDDGLAVVTFDQPGSTANRLSPELMTRLGEVVEDIACDDQISGVVFLSAKKSTFIAGAEIPECRGELTDEEVLAFVRRGQTIFQKIAELTIPTVAAIHGACLGGGYELALACAARIASDDNATRIGLPETTLGIIPTWGGSTRLPRLIGLRAALGLILTGERLTARKALRIGLVDRLVPKEHLLRIAKMMIQQGLPPRTNRHLANSALAAALLARKVRRKVLAKTRGHYPAPLAALDVVPRAARGGIQKGLDLELDAVQQLFRNPATAHLTRISRLIERAQNYKFEAHGPEPAPIGRIAVLGAGLHGAGIAQWAAAHGHWVILEDLSRPAVAQGLKTISGLFEAAVHHKVIDKAEARRGMDRIMPTEFNVPLTNIDLVIEAAAESLETKRQALAAIEERSDPETILATSTSAHSLQEISAGLLHPERVIGIHFFYPINKMQLVEIVIGRRTAAKVAGRCVRWVQTAGKLPVVVKDSPGFLVNRILFTYLIEAGLLFAAGAKIEDLDAAMLEFGMPIGPMRLLDEIGLEVAWHTAVGLSNAFGGRIPAPGILEEVIERGFFGHQNGKGFYLYGGRGQTPAVHREVAGMVGQGPASRLTRAELRDRMVLPMINEAARCLEEGIIAAPEDVDLGMVLGGGFAPFRGGPIRFADEWGAKQVVHQLDHLAAAIGPRFKPCAALLQLAESGETIYGRHRVEAARRNNGAVPAERTAAPPARTPPPLPAFVPPSGITTGRPKGELR